MIKKLLRKLAEYPRLRVLIVLAVIVIVILIIFELFTPKTQSLKLPSIPGSQIQNGAISQDAHQTQIGTQQREAQSKQLQQQAVQNTVKAGGDVFLSKLFGPNSSNANGSTSSASSAGSTNSGQTGSGQENIKSPEQVMQGDGNSTSNGSGAGSAPMMSPTQLQKAMNQQNYYGNNQGPNSYQQPGQQNQNQMQSQMASQMRSTMDSYSSQWGLPVQSYVQGSGPGTNGGGAGQFPAPPLMTMIKAGTILFAVLENALSSDQNGTPVLAQIATGEYRGGELLGSFSTSSDDKLVITFTQMILKNYPNPIVINAYAIDPATAENALASGVDHHYLQRYGGLFAASMLQGFGNAYSNYQNPCYGTSNCFVDGNVQKTSVTTETAAYQGLGQIGTNVASEVQNNFNRPDTVYLKQGSGMGILFMTNVTNQPSNLPSSSNSSASQSATPNVSPNAMIGNPAALKAFGNTSSAGMSLGNG